MDKAVENLMRIILDKPQMKTTKQKFKSPKQYVKEKLRMLRYDMYIYPTLEEVEHLYSLKTDVAIDNAVKALIGRHWAEE